MTAYEIENSAWWVQQWNDLLNSYRFKKRLERGRRYAREGHILSIKFKGSKVVAKVQGTAPEPYELYISIDSFSDEDWDFVIATMAQKAIYSAKLLAGEMPDDIEAVFTSNGLSLFPFTLSDVRSRCSCPDPKNPCKHIAAVYYQLGDFFREDPFVLFQLRGRSKQQILDAMRHKRSQASQAQAEDAKDAIATPENVSTADHAFELATPPPDLERFWDYDQPLDSSLVVITPPASGETVLDILGAPPLPPAEAKTVIQYLQQTYQTASQQAMMTALNRNG